MNIIAIDIGNTNITVGFFLGDIEKKIVKVAGDDQAKLAEVLADFWEQTPILASSKENKRNGAFVVASVKPAWTEAVRDIVKVQLGEKILEVGRDKDIPLPMTLAVDEPEKVGVDRVMLAWAAYTVVGDVVAVADVGTAVTVDLVDEDGTFLGGTIFPGFTIATKAISEGATALPNIEKIVEPKKPFGTNTAEAINNGIYYTTVGAIEVIFRMYADELGKWPQTIVTGGNMEIIKDGCTFVDNFVANLVVKGIVLTYKKYLEEKA